MRGNYVVLVDVDFLKAEGAKAIGLDRDRLAFDGAACVEWFTRFFLDRRFASLAPLFAERAFLRAYWYDAAYDPGDRRYLAQRAAFAALAMVPGLYLRLGHLQERTPAWQRAVRRAVEACGLRLSEFQRHFEFRPELEQKGVDALMTLDIASLSRDRAADLIVLVSGDRDVEEAMRIAQSVGCRVVLAHPSTAGVAVTLRQLADASLPIEASDLQRMLVPARRQGTAAA
jgi:uncharacterized LabA/DUF88 family protein